MIVAVVILTLQLAGLASLWALCEPPKSRPALTPEQRAAILQARELVDAFEKFAGAFVPAFEPLAKVVDDIVVMLEPIGHAILAGFADIYDLFFGQSEETK